MSPNYQNGKIYKIMSMNGENGDIYFGSTVQPLSYRIAEHRRKYKYWNEEKSNFISSYNLFDKYGVENCIIVLCENYPCNDIYELHAKEAEYIKNNPCVNKNIPNRTLKQHYEDNKNKILLRCKIYREQNKEKIKHQQKIHYDEIKEIISEKRKEKFVCVCGSSYTKHHELRHYESKKHQNFINKEVI